MRSFLRNVGLLALLLSGSANCQSNPIAHPPVCESKPTASLSFVGTLLDFERPERPGSFVKANFQVMEGLEGDSNDSETMLVATSLESCTQIGALKVGNDYLVKTTRLKNGQIWQLEHCDQLTALDKAQDELQYLRAVQSGKTSTQVFGEVREGYNGKNQPIPNAKVLLSRGEQKLEFVSDENGQFAGTLNPGDYNLSAVLPKGYEVSNYYNVPTSVTAVEHRCLRVSVFGEPTATIEGEIVDVDGDHLDIMSNVQLSLVTAEGEFVRSLWPDDGQLQTDHLRPGHYYLGVNIYLSPDRATAPYPPTYYPGVGSRDEAQEIVLEPGEHKRLGTMQIKKGTPCEISVVVIDQLGRHMEGSGIAVAYPDYPGFYLERELTDANGRGNAFAIFPGTVFLRATIQHPDGSAIQSDAAEIRSCPAEPLVLQLKRTVQAKQ